MPSRATTSRATTSRDELRRLKHAILDAELGLRGGGGGKGRDLPARRFYNEARRRLLRGGMTKEEQDALIAQIREGAKRYGERPDDDDAMEGREQGGGPTKRRRLDMAECPICFESIGPKLPDGERDPDPVLVGSPATGMRPAEPHSRAPITLHMASRLRLRGGVGENELHAAAVKGDADRVKLLLESGVDPNIASADEGKTPLHAAAANGHAGVVEVLLARGADPNTATISGATPCFMAAQNGHAGVVELLLARGADPNKAETANTKRTPLIVAIEYRRNEVVEVLLSSKRVDPNKASALHGKTPLIAAAEAGPAVRNPQPRVVELLLARGADPNKANSYGEAPLHAVAGQYIAGTWGRPAQQSAAVVRLLLKHGAVVDQINEDGITALDWARRWENQPVIEVLEEAYAGRAAARDIRLIDEIPFDLPGELYGVTQHIASYVHGDDAARRGVNMVERDLSNPERPQKKQRI